jgi:hypothetical protein
MWTYADLDQRTALARQKNTKKFRFIGTRVPYGTDTGILFHNFNFQLDTYRVRTIN